MTQPNPDWPHAGRYFVSHLSEPWTGILLPPGYLTGETPHAAAVATNEIYKFVHLMERGPSPHSYRTTSVRSATDLLARNGRWDPDPQPAESPDTLAEIRAELASLRAEVKALREGRRGSQADDGANKSAPRFGVSSAIDFAQQQAKPAALASPDIEQQAKAYAQARDQRDELASALRDLLGIVDQSYSVAGYHLNGDAAAWGQLEEANAARKALEGLDNG